MLKKDEKNSVLEICPVRNVIARFGNKWAFLVILVLSENGVTRFGELGKLIPDISSKVLSNTHCAAHSSTHRMGANKYEINTRKAQLLKLAGNRGQAKFNCDYDMLVKVLYLFGIEKYTLPDRHWGLYN